MAGNIPTYTADETAKTHEIRVQDQGGALAVWAGTQRISQGFSDLAQVGKQVAIQRQNKQKALARLDDIRWATEATQAEQLNVATFMADENNHKSEDFGDRVANYTKDRLSKYDVAGAPTPEAYRLFKANFEHLATQSTISAIDVGANNKVAGIINSTKSSIQSGIDSYRTLRGVNQEQATESLLNSIAQIRSSIDNGIKQFAPDMAHKLHEDLITQSVLSVMTTNPSTAKAILESSKETDEQTRYQLNNEINQASRNINIGQRETFLKAVEGTESFARQDGNKGLPVQPLSKVAFLDVLPAPHATEAYDKHIEKMKALNDSNAFLQHISSWNSDDLKKAANSVANPSDLTVENAVDQENFAQLVLHRVGDLITQQEKDPHGFLVKNNSHVQGLYDFASTVQDPQDRAAAITAANDTSLMYQGSAPKGIDTKESKNFLGLPVNGRHLLTVKSAEDTANEINISTPKEVIAKLGNVLGSSLNPEHSAIIFNDLVSLGKLSQQYQLAWLNKDAYWIDTYIGALAAGRDIKMPEKVVNDTATAVYKDKTFIKLGEALVGPNFQGSKQIIGFYEGVKQYSLALQSQNKTLKDSVEQATKMLISEQLAFVNLNGHQTMILKKDEKGNKRSDVEIENLGQNLVYALEHVPAHELNPSPFFATPGFKELYEQKPGEASTYLGHYINNRSYWQMLPNGQGAVLYGIDPNGVQNFQLSDKQGNPFIVHFKDLPESLKDANTEWARQARTATTTGATSYPMYQAQMNTTKPRPTWMSIK